MANNTVQDQTTELELYGRFIAKLAALVAHRFIMKPTGEKIEHWTSGIYAFGDHVYHFVHSVSSILIPVFLSLLLIRVSYKIILLRSDGTPGYLIILIYRTPIISHIMNWIRKQKRTFEKKESQFYTSQE